MTSDLPARPEIDRRHLADIAITLAAAFSSNGWTWGEPDGSLYVPKAADIALEIAARLPELTPGGSISSGRIGVEWELHEEGPDQITVHLDLGTISQEPQQ